MGGEKKTEKDKNIRGLGTKINIKSDQGAKLNSTYKSNKPEEGYFPMEVRPRSPRPKR